MTFETAPIIGSGVICSGLFVYLFGYLFVYLFCINLQQPWNDLKLQVLPQLQDVSVSTLGLGRYQALCEAVASPATSVHCLKGDSTMGLRTSRRGQLLKTSL